MYSLNSLYLYKVFFFKFCYLPENVFQEDIFLWTYVYFVQMFCLQFMYNSVNLHSLNICFNFEF